MMIEEVHFYHFISQELKEVLKKNLSNSAAKERIEKQIQLAEENLKNILAS